MWVIVPVLYNPILHILNVIIYEDWLDVSSYQFHLESRIPNLKKVRIILGFLFNVGKTVVSILIYSSDIAVLKELWHPGPRLPKLQPSLRGPVLYQLSYGVLIKEVIYIFFAHN